MIANGQILEIVFEHGCLDIADVARRVLAILNLENEIVKYYGKEVDQTEIIGLIRSAKKPAFKIETSKGIIHFSTVTAYKLQLLEVCGNENFDTSLLEALVCIFIEETGFIQANVSDAEYSFWQNAFDPIQYKANGRSYLQLPMISNGLPAPLEQFVVDVSSNPSRRVLRVGFVEMIGHVMWLGPKFWKIIGKQRRECILHSNNYQITELPNGVDRIAVLEGPFINEETTIAQKVLRDFLFG